VTGNGTNDRINGSVPLTKEVLVSESRQKVKHGGQGCGEESGTEFIANEHASNRTRNESGTEQFSRVNNFKYVRPNLEKPFPDLLKLSTNLFKPL
jgi:hypothetical protein